jgi:hypothetical protein
MSFTEHRLDNIDSLADVAGLILNENIDIYELVTTLTPEGVADFIGAASKAAEAGKKEFEFGGKTYPVKISKDVASKVAKKMNDSNSLEEYSEGGYPAQEVSYLPKDQKTGEVLEVDPKTEDPVHKDNIETKDGEKEEEENDPTKEMKGGKAKNEGFTEEEVRALCHSKNHNCATIIEHPEFGLGKPIHGSHAIPDDEGFVEWYDVEFKHGVEKKVYVEGVKVLASEGHMKNDEDEDPSDEDSKDENITMVDDFPIDEGKMKELHMDIKAGKSADDIIKSNKLPNTPAMKKYINELIKDTK